VSEYPNPALRSILLRTTVPFVPIWLLGTVLALLLAQLGLVGASLGLPRVTDFLAVYSVLVIALVGLLAVYQYHSTPEHIAVGVEGLLAWHDRDDRARVVNLPFDQFRTVVGRGLFGYRVEGRAASEPKGPVLWLNLTPENAERVAAAWLAWKAREAEPEPVFPGMAAAPAWLG